MSHVSTLDPSNGKFASGTRKAKTDREPLLGAGLPEKIEVSRANLGRGISHEGQCTTLRPAHLEWARREAIRPVVAANGGKQWYKHAP